MPVESATYISDLVTTNPVVTDDVSDAATHLKLIKQVLKASFPNITGALNATNTALDVAVTASGTAGVVTVGMGSTAASLVLRGSTDADTTTSDLTLTNTAGAVTATVGTTQVLKVDSTGNYTVPGNVTAKDFLLASGTDVGAYLVPPGAIIMWSGATTNIPTGWLLCNGTNGTPDLRDRFIIGAGGNYSVGNTGGATSVIPTTASAGAHLHTGNTGTAGGYSGSVATDTAGSHSHTGVTGDHALVISEIPSHDHGIAGETFSVGAGSGSYKALDVVAPETDASVSSTNDAGGGAAHSHSISSDGSHTHNVNLTVSAHSHTIASDGAHTHTVTVATVPPYYALCFIIKS